MVPSARQIHQSAVRFSTCALDRFHFMLLRVATQLFKSLRLYSYSCLSYFIHVPKLYQNLKALQFFAYSVKNE